MPALQPVTRVLSITACVGAGQFAQNGAGYVIGLSGQQAPPGFTLPQKAEH
jgi:hypothetical protein